MSNYQDLKLGKHKKRMLNREINVLKELEKLTDQKLLVIAPMKGIYDTFKYDTMDLANKDFLKKSSQTYKPLFDPAIRSFKMQYGIQTI
ncbi:MAG: hypothetical protein ACFFG0_07690 [Candidatus Thorarchaeota archaeon]